MSKCPGGECEANICEVCADALSDERAGCEEEIKKLKAENAALRDALYAAKSFHKHVCEIANVGHDDEQWLRDLASVEEAIRAQLSQAKAEVYEKVGNDIKVGLQKVDLTRSEALLVEIMANEYLLRAAQMRGKG